MMSDGTQPATQQQALTPAEQALNAAFSDVPSFTQLTAPAAPVSAAPTVADPLALVRADPVTPQNPSVAAPTVSSPQSLPPVGTTADVVSQLQSQLAEANAQRAYMQGVLEGRQTGAPAATNTPATPPIPFFAPTLDAASFALKPEEMAAYGESLPVINKIIQASLAGQQQHLAGFINKLHQQNAELAAKLSGVEENLGRTNAVSFDARLAAEIPNLQAATTHPGWRAHLQNVAPFSGGRTIEQQLVAAYKSNNAAVIAEYVKDFVAKSTQTTAAPQVSAPPGRASQAPVGSVPAGPEAAAILSGSKLDQLTKNAQSGKISQDVYASALSDVFAQAAMGATLTH